jgi:hypothetical protein
LKKCRQVLVLTFREALGPGSLVYELPLVAGLVLWGLRPEPGAGRGLTLELTLTSIDLLAWTRILLLDGDLTRAAPKKLR